MDWVETTGKNIEEATQRALLHLGVGSSDAEVEILDEPKAGLFGRVRGEARVRARIRPTTPRPKRTSRPQGKSERRSGEGRREGSSDARKGSSKSSEGQGDERPNRRRQNGTSSDAPKERTPRPQKEKDMAEGISLAEQAKIGKEFLEGLLAAMNLTAEVTVREIDAETVELAVNANPPTELGVLVGPRGTTLQAVQEVTRTVVQSKSPARTDRILVDVAQYRERRVAALGRFAAQIAQEVIDSGEERALEPMSSADRKAVHDALTDNASVATRSEGEDPRRFVVVAPA
ncbi:MAG: RNA-binding cell elongation regulator Jag/EloR [Actinomycetota bacterium]